jgi:hypothetical protein
MPGYSTSPSVYVTFSSLHAANNCGPIGGAISVTTLALNPTELSTSNLYTTLPGLSTTNIFGQWTPVNFADFGP